MIKKFWLAVAICVLVLCMMGCKGEKNNDTLQDTTTNMEESTSEQVEDKQNETTKEKAFMDSTTYVEEFVLGQDFNYMYQMDNNGLQIARAENGYYFHLGTLFYADATLETVVPICTKTTCDHVWADTECEGYLGSAPLMANFQHYNGKLYVATRKNLDTYEEFYNKDNGGFYCKLYECSVDMKEKKELDIIFENISPVIHRGFAYYLYMENVEKEINGKISTVRYGVLARVNLETGEEDRIFDSSTKLITGSNWIQNIIAYRNYVYFKTVEGVYVYCIKDGSVKKVENLDDLTKYKFWFMDDKLLIQYTDKEDEEKKKVYTANLDFTDVQYAFSKGHAREEVGSDNMYIYADNRFLSFRGDIDRVMYYYDKNTYELLGEINLGKGMGIEKYGYGDEKYYFYIESDEESYRLISVDKASLATGNIVKKVLVEW